MKQPLILKVRQPDESSFGRIAVSIILLLAAFIVIFHEQEGFPNEATTMGVEVGNPNEVVLNSAPIDNEQSLGAKRQQERDELHRTIRDRIIKESAKAETAVGAAGYGCGLATDGDPAQKAAVDAALTPWSTQAGAISKGIVNGNIDNVMGAENVAYTTLADEFVTKGKGIADAFGGDLSPFVNEHAGNHVFAAGMPGNIDGFNPATIASIAIGIILDQIFGASPANAMVKFAINAVVKVICLGVNIALFGTVWWIAVPLAAISLLVAFMGTEFPEDSAAKGVQQVIGDIGTAIKDGVSAVLSPIMKKLKSAVGPFLNSIWYFAKGLMDKAKALEPIEKLISYAGEIGGKISLGASTGWSIAKAGMSYSWCIAMCGIGLAQPPAQLVANMNAWNKLNELAWAPWNCKANGYYNPASALGGGGVSYDSTEFGRCCADPVGRKLEELNPQDHETEICSMWAPCCKKGNNRYFDILCCSESPPGSGNLAPSSKLSFWFPKQDLLTLRAKSPAKAAGAAAGPPIDLLGDLSAPGGTDDFDPNAPIQPKAAAPKVAAPKAGAVDVSEFDPLARSKMN